MATAELFRALGDTTRLEMVQRLSGGERYTISRLTNGLDITRQGARKHLQVLAEAEVVRLEAQGRDTFVSLRPDALEQAKAFIVTIEQQWDARLEALRQFVDDK